MAWPRALLLALSLASCGPTVAADTGDGDGSGSTTTTTGTVATTSMTGPSSAATTATSSSEVDSGTIDGSTTETPKPDVPGCALLCNGVVYRCVDGVDNDGDGLVDLQDPECIGPCDDDEGAFQRGVIDRVRDCRIDCQFDGNSGQGDDNCVTDLRCDPLSPGTPIGCDYDPPMGPNDLCADGPEPIADGCVPLCTQFTLPGCDCFGCCTFGGADGEQTVFIMGSSDCRLDNLAACPACTSRIDECGNVCGGCEICIGETEPIAGCQANFCANSNRCAAQDDCACGEACVLGCCLPIPP